VREADFAGAKNLPVELAALLEAGDPAAPVGQPVTA
jgi:hypothetical protein